MAPKLKKDIFPVAEKLSMVSDDCNVTEETLKTKIETAVETNDKVDDVLLRKALTDEQKEKLEKISKPCREQTGASLETVEKARRGEHVDDPKLKKNLLCVFKKLELVDADGKISEEKIHERVKAAAGTEERADEICKKCKKAAKGKESPEETLAAAVKCIRDELPDFSPVE